MLPAAMEHAKKEQQRAAIAKGQGGSSAQAVVEAIARASLLARHGDFQLARWQIHKARERLNEGDRARLDALESSFRIDPAVGVVIALTAVALLIIAGAALFR